MKKIKTFGIIALAALGLLAAGCSITGSSSGSSSTTTTGTGVSTVNPAAAQGQSFTQVEFLARPAVGEGIFLQNSSQNLYNSVGPAFISAVLTNPGGPESSTPGVGALLADGTGILTALVALKPAGSGLTVAALIGALLPDVNRIDTTLAFSPAPPAEVPAYASVTNNAGSPCSGRKLTDDSIDITLTVLTGGTIKVGNAANGLNNGDGVPYYRPAAGAGSTNGAIGHHFLNGQVQKWGTSAFPFLAPPL